MAEIKSVRRKLSARLAKAERAGRFMDELRAIEHEGEKALREAVAEGKTPRKRKHA